MAVQYCINAVLVHCIASSPILFQKLGNLYARGKFDQPECRRRYYGDYYRATFTVPLGECGMKKIRQHHPFGSLYSIVTVVNFHPRFVTKYDKAYLIKCFYAKNDNEVKSKLEVSPLYPETVHETAVALPMCKYSLRENSVDGRPLQYAKIGDRIVHRWECDNPFYGMLVKNCYVTDGSGTSVNIVDSFG
uniref:ZP domain-containing protein n=1 Tax=Syphacia muris TaxID=451379 RepID=A0A0N5AMC9_9BILA